MRPTFRQLGRPFAASTAALAMLVVPLTPAVDLVLPTAATGQQVADALDIPAGDIKGVEVSAAAGAIEIVSKQFGQFPSGNQNYAVLSTGYADQVVGSNQDEHLSTTLGTGNSVDGNDLTSLNIDLVPPADAQCLAFDFQFLSEEYPDFVGSQFNDIFTAELNESKFTMHENQVIAPHNFAYDVGGEFISINTVLGFDEVQGTAMNGSTAPLVAVSPVELNDDNRVNLILTIQDLGDSIYDSAVIVDNFRWLYGGNCERTVSDLTDSDGDGLPDHWETEGLDYDGDGVPEVDLPALGADPQRADIFVQVDWMENPQTCFWFVCWGARDFKPQQEALDATVQAFADSPYQNPDGSTGVNLHLSLGSAVSWEQYILDVEDDALNWTKFEALKSEHFSDLKRDVFHYAVYADKLADHADVVSSSGISRGLPGADFLVTDGHESWEGGFSILEERGTFMHELGHNLGLMHGGPDHSTYQDDPSYRSVMNYFYQLSGISPGNTLDYSDDAPHDDWAHLIFNGGSIGDLGDNQPEMLTEILKELTPEDATPVQGDGKLVFEGPTLLASNVPAQEIFATVINPAAQPTNYSLRVLDSQGAEIGRHTLTVAGESSEVARVEFDAKSLMNTGELNFELKLDSATLGMTVASTSAQVQVVDLSDPQNMKHLEEAMESLKQQSPDLPQEVLDSLEQKLKIEINEPPEPDAEPSVDPSPDTTPSSTPDTTPSSTPDGTAPTDATDGTPPTGDTDPSQDGKTQPSDPKKTGENLAESGADVLWIVGGAALAIGAGIWLFTLRPRKGHRH